MDGRHFKIVGTTIKLELIFTVFTHRLIIHDIMCNINTMTVTHSRL